MPSNKPAVHEVWNIATALLYSIAVALLVYGILIVASAWLAGATRSATAVRRSLAPTLRDHPGMAYGSVGAVLLLVVAWGPTPAFRQLAWVALFTALLALAVTMLRRQTAIEFAGAQKGDTMRGAREGWSARRSGAARAPEPTPESTEAERLNDLERLTQLHDRGVLSDDEFAEKTNVLNGS